MLKSPISFATLYIIYYNMIVQHTDPQKGGEYYV